MIDKKNSISTISLPLKNAGYIRKGQSWYLDGKDAVIVITLEGIGRFIKGQYVINVGIWLTTLRENSHPPYNQCHLYYQLDGLFPQFRELILTSCYLDGSNAALLADLSDFINSKVIPFLQDCTHVEKLREFMAQGIMNDGLVRREIREYLVG